MRAPGSRKPKPAPLRKLSPKLRRDAVEAALRQHGWDEVVLTELLKKTGSSRATLYRDRDAIAKLLADEEAATLSQRRALFLGDLRRLRAAATKAHEYSPAAKLLALEGRIQGVDQPDLPDVEDEGPVDTSLEGMLAAVRRQRRRADAGNSHIAVEKLLDREHEIVRDIEARERAKREKELDHLDEEELVNAVASMASLLTDAQREKLRQALG